MIAVFMLCGCDFREPQRPVVRLSAAASLGPSLEALKPRIEAEFGITLRLNLAGSGTLARQLIDGAPADAVILAHPEWMDAVTDTPRADVQSKVDLLSNTLVVVGRGGEIELGELRDAERFRRIALGDPASVPAGRYAEKALRDAGVWEEVQSRLVTTADVRAALRYTQIGEVDAAVVYASDVTGLADAQSQDRKSLAVLCRIDPARHEPIVIPAAAIDRSAEGRRLIDWLRSEAARNVFVEHGFIPR